MFNRINVLPALQVAMHNSEDFDIKFTISEVSAWGRLVLLKRMIDGMSFFQAIESWELPFLGSKRSYDQAHLIEKMIVSIWCGA